MVAMQGASQHFTSTGRAAVSQDYYRLPGQLPRLSREHLSRQGTCLTHASQVVRIAVVSPMLMLTRTHETCVSVVI